MTRREAEDELLRVGADWERALRSYNESTPGHAALGPTKFEDLLRDPRFPGLRRHLRQVPLDPMTNSTEWAVVRSPDGQIIGIHSRSQEPVIRRSGLPLEWQAFANAKTHRDWVFQVVTAR